MTVSEQRASRVLAYVRVSTSEQAGSGAGMAAQRAAIRAEALRRGWTNILYVEDAGYSARSLDRPGLRQALDMLASGQAATLCVAKLDRLSRSLLDFASLVDTAHRQRWSIVCLDLGLDMSSPSGRLMSNVLASFAQFERDMASARTREALAAKRAAGVRLGRPVTLPAFVRARIRAERAAGATLTAIADRLNADGTPTAQGGARWYPSTVAAILKQAS